MFFTSASELLRAAPVVWDYPICIPFRRVKQLRATADGFESVCPSTWNFLMYGPPVDEAITDIDKITLFHNTFRDIGRIIYSEYAGDSWTKDPSITKSNEVMYEQAHSSDIFYELPSGNKVHPSRLIHRDGTLMWKHALLYQMKSASLKTKQLKST